MVSAGNFLCRADCRVTFLPPLLPHEQRSLRNTNGTERDIHCVHLPAHNLHSATTHCLPIDYYLVWVFTSSYCVGVYFVRGWRLCVCVCMCVCVYVCMCVCVCVCVCVRERE